MTHQNPVIVIPGITGSGLVDHYPLDADEIWSMIFNKDHERLALHPDDLRFEAIGPADVAVGRLIPIYDDLIKALRHELSPRADQPTPVFAFPYDWRMDVRQNALRLREFIDEVIARTRLLRHYANASELRVDLVGHSMGGLIIGELLAEFGRAAQVGKVVTIGTPWHGSIEAIVKMATGMSLLTGSDPQEREREAARVTPALYQLFPHYPGATVDASGNEVDLYDPSNMQASIINSLTEFVRIYSVDTRADQRRNRAQAILDDMLQSAKRHRDVMHRFKISAASMSQADWLVIAGVGEKTRLQVSVERNRAGPRFVLAEHQFVNELSAEKPGSQRTGDGTVPLASAIPPFLPAANVVCVTDDDLAFMEFRDRLLVEFAGLHGLLPRVNLVQRLATKHFRSAYRGNVWGRRVPGVASWKPPISGLSELSY